MITQGLQTYSRDSDPLNWRQLKRPSCSNTTFRDTCQTTSFAINVGLAVTTYLFSIRFSTPLPSSFSNCLPLSPSLHFSSAYTAPTARTVSGAEMLPVVPRNQPPHHMLVEREGTRGGACLFPSLSTFLVPSETPS